MTFTRKEEEANYYKNPNLRGLRTTALTSKTGFHAPRQLWSPITPKKPPQLHHNSRPSEAVWGTQHSAINLFLKPCDMQSKPYYLSFKSCVQKGARVENLSMPLLNMGGTFSLKKTCPALLSQPIHFAFFTSFTLIILCETNLLAVL